ncbi:MAG: SpoIID/LytB domain-containing protein [Candidatus Eremiobacteraeota bacterium]|nr:SpoIID/LytB domain-containing protein [Candidatus Eremiobacteraeota bacterium]
MALALTPWLGVRAARAQNEFDPAITSSRQALRVLLGEGDATAVSADSFTFEGRLYRGNFQRDATGSVVNFVDLEQYLYSVVSREMPASWPSFALQAQSICARTYVLERSDPRRGYDLVPSELDQVYEGISGETPAGTAAVGSTSGEVISFESVFAQVAYSSCCGGHTESSADLWGNAALPYLSGVTCGWCTESPSYRWQRSLSFETLAQRLASGQPELGTVLDLRIDARDSSGRARTLELVTGGGSLSVAGSAFRRAVGSRVLPSLLLTGITRLPDGSGVLIEGGGLGHGVGLCQWGARGMARAGRLASQILAFYLPRTDIRNLS